MLEVIVPLLVGLVTVASEFAPPETCVRAPDVVVSSRSHDLQVAFTEGGTFNQHSCSYVYVTADKTTCSIAEISCSYGRNDCAIGDMVSLTFSIVDENFSSPFVVEPSTNFRMLSNFFYIRLQSRTSAGSAGCLDDIGGVFSCYASCFKDFHPSFWDCALFWEWF